MNDEKKGETGINLALETKYLKGRDSVRGITRGALPGNKNRNKNHPSPTMQLIDDMKDEKALGIKIKYIPVDWKTAAFGSCF